MHGLINIASTFQVHKRFRTCVSVELNLFGFYKIDKNLNSLDKTREIAAVTLVPSATPADMRCFRSNSQPTERN